MVKARRVEIWLIDLGLVQKTRPCLVMSVDYLDHERAVVTVAETGQRVFAVQIRPGAQ